MIAHLIIEKYLDQRILEIEKIMTKYNFSKNRPNMLWIDDEKVGIAQAKLIRDHFSLKPFEGSSSAAVIIQADSMTQEAQNSLLKTIEELKEENLIILGSSSETSLVPPIVSRCFLIYPQTSQSSQKLKFQEDINQLKQMNIESRFVFIEKLNDKESFLNELEYFFQQSLQKSPDQSSQKDNIHFLEKILEAQKWAQQNVNIRAVLEYLMLEMP